MQFPFDCLHAASLRIFGETLVYAPGGGEPVSLRAVWRDEEALMPPGVRAMVWFLEAALGGMAPAKGDLVMRAGVTYRVVDPPSGGIAGQRDGVGGITIYLREVSHAADA